MGNFQIHNLEQLQKDIQREASIEIIDVSKFTINNDKINIDNITQQKMALLQNNSRVIYIESPVHWKLKNALSRATRLNPFDSERRSLNVPKYFIDLNFTLMEEFSGDIAFPKIFEELTKKIIKGKIIINESGTLNFQEENNGKSHSLPMTATGIVPLGLLALLIEKKILDKGTVLFFDEPETNLHPAWQVKMMKVLFQLVKSGVHIITATHSADMLKWLEVHLEEHPDDEQLIALNQMEINDDKDKTVSVNKSDINVKERITSIKKNLTEPFLDLFLTGKTQ